VFAKERRDGGGVEEDVAVVLVVAAVGAVGLPDERGHVAVEPLR
jgi:hypothetical protein